MFSIDNVTWDVPCQIERVAEMTASEISGLMLDRTYFNDVFGTYLRYDVTIAVPFGMENEYLSIYETITQPVEGHTFVLPYNNGTVTLAGRVENISDVYMRGPGDSVHWKGIKFSVASNAPTKIMSLGETIARGRTATPDVQDPETGDTYQWNGTVWVDVTYPDADNRYY